MNRHLKEVLNEVQRSQKMDSLVKSWQEEFVSIAHTYVPENADTSIVNQIKQKAEHSLRTFNEAFESFINTKELDFDLKYSKQINSIVLRNVASLDTLFGVISDTPIQMAGDPIQANTAFVSNSTIFSFATAQIYYEASEVKDNILNVQPYSSFEFVDLSINSLPLKELQSGIGQNASLELEWEDIIYIPNQKRFLLQSMIGLISASVAIFLFVIALLFYSIRSLIIQKKIADIKTDFVNNITHEFKTPIASLDVAVKSLKSKTIVDNPKLMEHTVEIIENQKTRLQRLIDEAMHNSLSSKSLILNKEEVFDVIFFTQLLKSFEHTFKIPETNIIKELKQAQAIVELDTFHFTTALWNILENALKYGGATSKLTFKTASDKTFYSIEICNTNSSISKKEQALIFDKFYRVHTGNLHKVKGMGLGLYYTQQIIKAHNGTISVQSEKNRVCFTIKIPLYSNEKN